MLTFQYLGKHGRFGNQLFQYATLYSVAKTNGYKFGVPYLHRNEHFDICLKDCFDNLTAEDSSYSTYYKTNQFLYNDTRYNPEVFDVKDNTDIKGYFQSEKYFKKYRNELLFEFEFKKEILSKAQNFKNILKNEVISVHVRLGDYESLQDVYPKCTENYYLTALEMLPKDATIIIFSDEPKKAIELFKKVNRPHILSDGTDRYVDMCTMTLCDYHIIANSSFSWWGAWMSNSKKVISPSKWYGRAPGAPKEWDDIYCPEWIKH